MKSTTICQGSVNCAPLTLSITSFEAVARMHDDSKPLAGYNTPQRNLSGRGGYPKRPINYILRPYRLILGSL